MISALIDLRGQLDAWIRTRLWAQVLAGLVLGILVGYLLGPDLHWVERDTSEAVGRWLAFPGNVFLGLISMVLVPLVIGSIVQGLNGSQSASELKRVGGRFVIYVVLTTAFAATLGLALTNHFEPGNTIQMDLPVTDVPPPRQADAVSVPDALMRMLPTNPLVAFAELDMLAIVIFAVIFGLAARASDRQRLTVLLSFIDGAVEVSMRVVKWAMFITPWAVFGLMAQLIANVGIATVLGMTAYVLTVLAGLLGVLTLYLALVAIVGKRNPFRFLAQIRDPVILAFSTLSSTAVMPLSIDTAVKKLAVPESTASLIIPFGATINMAGTALYQSVAIMLLAQISGVELSVTQQIGIVATLVAASIGAPGTPGVGIVILGSIAGDFGIPLTALPLVLGVDRILDMARTAVNLTGDLTACVLLSRSDR